jgi:sugar lactone lactonase YvrE
MFAIEITPDGLGIRHEFAGTMGQAATPDGSAIDSEGFLWNAQWDGWRVVRYAPDGRLDRVIDLPVQRPTSCTFGGPGGATLFITSARDDLTDAQLSAQPLAGGVFAVVSDVAGAAPLYFEG